MDEQVFYEPEPIQGQEQIVVVYRYNNKLYIDGYTMNAAGKTSSAFKTADNLYEVYGEDLQEICTNIAGGNGFAKIEYRQMKPEQVKQIVEYNDNNLNSMFSNNVNNEQTGRVR